MAWELSGNSLETGASTTPCWTKACTPLPASARRRVDDFLNDGYSGATTAKGFQPIENYGVIGNMRSP
jgi:hypothetical protein